MSYAVNPSKWNKIFAIPSAVVDEHIKLAGSAQLKVLLWTLRHNDDGFDIKKLSKDTGISAADALDAMQFWIETGILVPDKDEAQSVKETKPDLPKAEAKPKKDSVKAEKDNKKDKTPEGITHINASVVNKPTNEDVAARGEESEEIRFLWNECQLKLGKTLSFNDQRTLLWMHDHLGLPVEVILIIVEYCASRKKYGTAYIEKVGVSWAQEEIFSISAAESKLREMAERENIWKKLCRDFGMQNAVPTAKQAEMLDSWKNGFGYDYQIIHRAFEECIDRTGKIQLNYINKVLSNWHDSGYRTLKEINSAGAKSKDAKPQGASYDLDAFEKASLKTPVYKKKGDN